MKVTFIFLLIFVLVPALAENHMSDAEAAERLRKIAKDLLKIAEDLSTKDTSQTTPLSMTSTTSSSTTTIQTTAPD